MSEANSVPGFLADSQIQQALDAGELIRPGSWDIQQIRHASYTLRLGSQVYLRDPSDSLSGTNHSTGFRVCNLQPGDTVTLAPGATARLYSAEHLLIPKDMFALTVARGLLFVEGLTPGSTYVDPGFSGELYTAVTNVSNRTVKLPYGISLCRIFFYRFAEPVARPYVSGPTLGIAQQLDEVPIDPPPSIQDIRRSPTRQLVRSLSSDAVEIETQDQLLSRFNRSYVTLAAVAVLWPMALLVLFANRSSNVFQTVLWGAVGSLVATAIVYVATRMINKGAWLGGSRDA